MDTPTLTWTCTKCDQLKKELAEARAESLEQSRLLGMSGEREAKLRGDIYRLVRESVRYQAEMSQALKSDHAWVSTEEIPVDVAKLQEEIAKLRDDKDVLAKSLVNNCDILGRQLSEARIERDAYREALVHIRAWLNDGTMEPNNIARDVLAEFERREPRTT
jgi:hypothetical protein